MLIIKIVVESIAGTIEFLDLITYNFEVNLFIQLSSCS